MKLFRSHRAVRVRSIMAVLVMLATIAAGTSTQARIASAGTAPLDGSISGTVTNSSGDPVANVQVYAYADAAGDGNGWTATAADGTFTTTGLAPGTYKVQFSSADGSLASQYWNNQLGYYSATTVTVTIEENTPSIDAVLQPAGSISGTVTNSTGDPLANVSVITDGDGGGTNSATTAADGTYTINGLATDSYSVYFSPPAGSLVSQYWDAQPGYDTATPVALTAPGNVAGINAALQAGGTISGTVTDSTGDPVADVYVSASGTGDGYGSTFTAADGTYTITGLAADTYTVEFDSLPGANLQSQYWMDTADQSSATPIALAIEGSVTGIDASLRPISKTLQGTITDATSAATLSNTCATLWSGTSQLRTACSDSNGVFEMNNVAPGTYTLSFVDAGGTHVTQWAGGAATQGASTPVVIVDDGTPVTVDAAMAGVPGTISGTVSLSGKNPSRNECVYLYKPGAAGTYAGQATCINADGKYLLSGMAPGDYVVAFVDPMGLTPTIWSGGAATQAAATTVTVSAGSATTGVDVSPVPAPGTVVGEVFHPDRSAGLANICVYAYAYNATTDTLASTATAATCTNSQG